MTCGQFDQLVCDFVAGELPCALLQAVHRHLNVCPVCAREMFSYLRTIALARDSMNADVYSDVPGDLIYSALHAIEDLA